jgi:hypothetical protein
MTLDSASAKDIAAKDGIDWEKAPLPPNWDRAVDPTTRMVTVLLGSGVLAT